MEAATHGDRAAAGRPQPSAILCLGGILRGATTHAQHIGEAVSRTVAEREALLEFAV